MIGCPKMLETNYQHCIAYQKSDELTYTSKDALNGICI
jgi:hypothetical protein